MIQQETHTDIQLFNIDAKFQPDASTNLDAWAAHSHFSMQRVVISIRL